MQFCQYFKRILYVYRGSAYNTQSAVLILIGLNSYFENPNLQLNTFTYSSYSCQSQIHLVDLVASVSVRLVPASLFLQLAFLGVPSHLKTQMYCFEAAFALLVLLGSRHV